jgi:hypothetical protein
VTEAEIDKTRSFISFILLLVIVQSVLLGQVTLRLPEMKARVGSEVTIPLRVEGLAGRNVTSFGFVISCDASILRLKGTDQRGTLSEGMMMVSNNKVPPYGVGRMKVGCAGAQPISGSGVLVKILATVRKKGTSSLNLSDILLNAGTPQAKSTDGRIKCESASKREAADRKSVRREPT